MPGFKKQNILMLLITILLSALLFTQLGCEGPRGPQGTGIEDLDFSPPQIKFSWPVASDTAYTDTLTVIATATDSVEMAFVEFFIDGQNDLGLVSGAIARDSFPSDDNLNLYSIQWNLDSADVKFGLHSLVARAVDKSGNEAFTPPIFLYRSTLPFRQILVYDFAYDEYVMTLPDEYNDKYLYVRFSPLAPCKLIEIRYDLVDPNGYMTGEGSDVFEDQCNVEIKIWSSVDKFPANELSSRDIEAADIDLTSGEWNVFNYAAENLLFDGDFHAGISPIDSLYASYKEQRLGLALVYSLDDGAGTDPIEHRSGEFETQGSTPGWGTMMQDWNNQKRDLHIRALVEYGDGQVDMLEPQPALKRLSKPGILNSGK